MCYLCRKNIGSTKSGSGDEEGYRHFCEHFRAVPGKACTECSKCDLYRTEDEDEVVRQAGEEAERRWRISEGMVDVAGLDEAIDAIDGRRTVVDRFVRGQWTLQGLVDWAVEKVVVLESE